MNALTPVKRPASSMPTVAYIIEPRYPGGTSSAVAQELRTLAKIAKPNVYCIASKQFSGSSIAPQLEQVFDELGLLVEWDPVKISADIVILHNPSFLKFQSDLPVRIVADRLYVVTHENFTRPGGALSFDVSGCLKQINDSVVAKEKYLAPISVYNRSTVEGWMSSEWMQSTWQVVPEDWFNICDFEFSDATDHPTDRRGRLSRPGFEKFPNVEAMEFCFPPAAERNLLLGAENLTDLAAEHPHWEIVPFRGMEVDAFFDAIDFLVHFTSNTWRESFGRVLAEGIAAGKVVISDAATAETFGDAVIAARPSDIDGLINAFVQNPKTYQNQVCMAQKALEKFSGENFQIFLEKHVFKIQGFQS